MCPEKFPDTPLHRAVERGSVEVTRLLKRTQLTLAFYRCQCPEKRKLDLVFKYRRARVI